MLHLNQSGFIDLGSRLDMAISLASGKPFLNHFEVQSRAIKVLLIDGATPDREMNRNLRLILETKGLQSCPFDNLLFAKDLPKIDDPEQVTDLVEMAREHCVEVIIISPLLLAFNDVESIKISGGCRTKTYSIFHYSSKSWNYNSSRASLVH